MSKITPVRWWRDDATRYQSRPPYEGGYQGLRAPDDFGWALQMLNIVAKTNVGWWRFADFGISVLDPKYEVNCDVIRELAARMHWLRCSGSTVFVTNVDDWQLACAQGHDGLADNTELWNARQALGEVRCSAIYEAERTRRRS
jgi:hypothetical protein